MKVAAALGASIVVAAVPAGAQDTALGSRIAKHDVVHSDYSSTRAQVGAHIFVKCLVHRRSQSAAMMLDSVNDRTIAVYDKALSREADCIGLAGDTELQDSFQMSAATPLWRGLVAEERILERYAAARADPLPLQRTYASQWTAVDGRAAAMDDMAVCVAAINPAGIRALIATPPASAQEAAAVGALTPSLGQCLQANATFAGNRQSVRAALAEALYHRLAATPSQPAGN